MFLYALYKNEKEARKVIEQDLSYLGFNRVEHVSKESFLEEGFPSLVDITQVGTLSSFVTGKIPPAVYKDSRGTALIGNKAARHAWLAETDVNQWEKLMLTDINVDVWKELCISASEETVSIEGLKTNYLQVISVFRQTIVDYAVLHDLEIFEMHADSVSFETYFYADPPVRRLAFANAARGISEQCKTQPSDVPLDIIRKLKEDLEQARKDNDELCERLNKITERNVGISMGLIEEEEEK